MKKFRLTIQCRDIAASRKFYTEFHTKHQLALDMGYNATEIRHPNENSNYFYVYDPDHLSIEYRIG